jgi:nicotinate phosphoribosyltransferase
MMRGGERLPDSRVAIDAARRHAAAEIARLPAAIRDLEPAEKPYPVEVSPALRAFEREVEAALNI